MVGKWGEEGGGVVRRSGQEEWSGGVVRREGGRKRTGQGERRRRGQGQVGWGGGGGGRREEQQWRSGAGVVKHCPCNKVQVWIINFACTSASKKLFFGRDPPLYPEHCMKHLCKTSIHLQTRMQGASCGTRLELLDRLYNWLAVCLCVRSLFVLTVSVSSSYYYSLYRQLCTRLIPDAVASCCSLGDFKMLVMVAMALAGDHCEWVGIGLCRGIKGGGGRR